MTFFLLAGIDSITEGILDWIVVFIKIFIICSCIVDTFLFIIITIESSCCWLVISAYLADDAFVRLNIPYVVVAVSICKKQISVMSVVGL